MKEETQKKCLYCGRLLGRVHGLRKFCPNSFEQDGSIRSCKDDYHNKSKNKPIRDATKGLVKIHYNNFLVLDRLYKSGKTILNWQELKDAGCYTDYYVARKKIAETTSYEIFHIGYFLRQVNQTQLRILKHDIKF